MQLCELNLWHYFNSMNNDFTELAELKFTGDTILITENQ